MALKNLSTFTFLPVERGWAWQIPITDKITSMGVVAERSIFRQARLDVEAYFNHYVNSNPDLARAMRRHGVSMSSSLKGDYSYSMEQTGGQWLCANRGCSPLCRPYLFFWGEHCPV
jgi:hypothetical protein